MQALILDFDGLILDTETPEVQLWDEIFAEHDLVFPEAWWKDMVGRLTEPHEERPHQILARLSSGRVSAEVAAAEHHRRFLTRIHEDDARPGIRSLIALVREAGLKLGLASSSKHEWVDGHLKRLGLFQEFDGILCSDDVPRAKPHPDLYLAAVQSLSVSPQLALALEDSPNGVAAARAAGLSVYAYPNPITIHLDLSAADQIVDNAMDAGLLARLGLTGPGR